MRGAMKAEGLQTHVHDSKELKKIMEKVGYKCIAVQARCMENLAYTSWEPNLHTKFPQKTYAELLGSMQR
jgi:hypothetical protein